MFYEGTMAIAYVGFLFELEMEMLVCSTGGRQMLEWSVF